MSGQRSGLHLAIKVVGGWSLYKSVFVDVDEDEVRKAAFDGLRSPHNCSRLKASGNCEMDLTRR